MKFKAKVDLATEKRPFTEDEARTILVAARSQKQDYKRWAPWVSAFTGARIDEVCGALASAIQQENGIWLIYYHPKVREGGRAMKNNITPRKVPLHPALIDEGFLEYAKRLPPNGPLFPGCVPDAYGRRGGTGSDEIRKWVRNVLRITDPTIQPNHGWRHRFKSIAPDTGMRQDVEDYLTGHKGNRTDADVYRKYGIRVLADAIALLPNPTAKQG